jgi:hypothetical protein
VRSIHIDIHRTEDFKEASRIVALFHGYFKFFSMISVDISVTLNSFSNFYVQLIVLWKTYAIGNIKDLFHHAQVIAQAII